METNGIIKVSMHYKHKLASPEKSSAAHCFIQLLVFIVSIQKISFFMEFKGFQRDVPFGLLGRFGKTSIRRRLFKAGYLTIPDWNDCSD